MYGLKTSKKEQKPRATPLSHPWCHGCWAQEQAAEIIIAVHLSSIEPSCPTTGVFCAANTRHTSTATRWTLSKLVSYHCSYEIPEAYCHSKEGVGMGWDGMLHQQLSIPSNAIQMTGMCMQWTIMNWNGTQLWFGRWGWFCWDTMAQILPSSFDWRKQTMRVCVFVISGRLMLWKDKEKFNTVFAMVNVMHKLVIPFLNFVLCRMIIDHWSY